MSIQYKVDVLQSLRGAGYNPARLRKEKLMGESTIQQLREGKLVSWKNIDKICELLQCNIGDLLEYKNEDGTTPEHFEGEQFIKITRY